MKLLKTIIEKDIGWDNNTKVVKYNVRETARAVVFNDKNEVALFFVSKYGFHKIPGGRLEKNENIVDALKREIIEEVGAEIEIICELGKILEIADKHSLKQISYCYSVKVIGELSPQKFEDYEISDGYKLEWIPLEKAIEIMNKKNKSDNYVGKFTEIRDLIFLKEAKKTLPRPHRQRSVAGRENA